MKQEESLKNLISSPFCSSRPFVEKKFTEREYVHYMEVEKVSKDFNPDKPEEFLIEKEIVEYERVPIDEHINSFSSKVGLKNELKGIVSKKQMDDFISVHKAQPGFVDLTKLPDSALSMGEYAVKVDKIWNDIPIELRRGLTKEEFLKTITAEKVHSYVCSKLPKQKLKEEVKKEG